MTVIARLVSNVGSGFVRGSASAKIAARQMLQDVTLRASKVLGPQQPMYFTYLPTLLMEHPDKAAVSYGFVILSKNLKAIAKSSSAQVLWNTPSMMGVRMFLGEHIGQPLKQGVTAIKRKRLSRLG